MQRFFLGLEELSNLVSWQKVIFIYITIYHSVQKKNVSFHYYIYIIYLLLRKTIYWYIWWIQRDHICLKRKKRATNGVLKNAFTKLINYYLVFLYDVSENKGKKKNLYITYYCFSVTLKCVRTLKYIFSIKCFTYNI